MVAGLLQACVGCPWQRCGAFGWWPWLTDLGQLVGSGVRVLCGCLSKGASLGTVCCPTGCAKASSTHDQAAKP
jgi:hypothetical protein